MNHKTRKYMFGRYLLIGGIAGLFSGFFGVGGGIVMVPLIMFFLGFDQKKAATHSLVAIMPTALFASISYFVSGTVPLDQIGFGLCISVGSALTAPLGTKALRRWNIRTIRWIFLISLVVAAIFVFTALPDRNAHLEWNWATLIVLILLGGAMGFLAGLLGIGGGLLVVPALILGYGISDLTAKALSLVAIVAGSVSGTIESNRAGKVSWGIGLALGLPMSIAGTAGVWLATIVPGEFAMPIFAALMIFAATQIALGSKNKVS